MVKRRVKKWQDVHQLCVKDKEMAKNIGHPYNVVFLNMEDSQLARRS